MSEIQNVPLNPMQYGLLSISLKNLASEQALEIDRQIQRQVMREGLRGIVISIDEDEYDELVYALCYMAQHSGIGAASGNLIKHIKYFMRKTERFK
jgi:hypothetical protein